MMLNLANKLKFLLVLSLLATSSAEAVSSEKLSSDPRIKTFIYGKNDVFKINSVYGFQTVIELSPEEKIQTISVGNPNIFKILPSGNRIFIKAMQDSQLTNMVIITDIRSYDFDLSSEVSTDGTDNEKMYSVRFIYPEELGAANYQSKDSAMDIYSPLNLPKIKPASSAPNFSYQIPSTSGIIPSSPKIDTAPISERIESTHPEKHLQPKSILFK